MIDRRLSVLATSLLVFAATGCLKEKVKLTVYPEGHGTIAVHQQIGSQMAGMMMMGKEDPKEAMQEVLNKELAKYDGVCAWTETKTEKTDQGALKVSALGYFEDVTKLKSGEDATTTYTWAKNSDGGFTLGVNQGQRDGKKGAKDPADDFLKKMPEDQMAMMKGMMQGMLAGLKFELVFEMPGDVTAIEGAQTKEGRTATFAISEKEISKLMDTGYTKGQELRKQIDDGKMTEDDARKEMHKEFADVEKPIKVTCKAGDVAAASKECLEKMAAAKKEYAGSDLEKQVKKAKDDAAAKKAMGGPGMGGDDHEGGDMEPKKKDKKGDDDGD